MRIIGHRGARRLALENTIDSLRVAFEEGADGIEFDVRLSGDGEPVVWHDDDLRAWGGSAVPIRRQRWRELRAVALSDSAGRRGTMAHFDEVLEQFGHSQRGINIELKVGADPPGTGQRLAEVVLRRLSARPQAGWTVSSFDRKALETVAAGAADVQLAALVRVSACQLQAIGNTDPEHIAAALAALNLPLKAMHADFGLIDKARCAAWRDCGLAVVAWTVNESTDWQLSRSLGLDAMITDDPGGARRWQQTAI